MLQGRLLQQGRLLRGQAGVGVAGWTAGWTAARTTGWTATAPAHAALFSLRSSSSAASLGLNARPVAAPALASFKQRWLIWHQGHQGHQGHSARPLSSGSGSGSAPGSTPTPTQPSQRPPASENIYNLPNALTLSRIVMTPFIGLLIVQQAFPAAVALLSVAAFTDLADGFIARRYNLKTALGSALDPAADKILMTTLTVSLCQAGLLPLYLAVLIIGRDVGLVLATAYYRYATLPAPKTVQRYFNLALPSAEVRPPFISKLNTLLQLTLMGASLCMPLLGLADAMLLTLLQYTVAVTTIWSGLHYMFAKDVIKAIK